MRLCSPEQALGGEDHAQDDQHQPCQSLGGFPVAFGDPRTQMQAELRGGEGLNADADDDRDQRQMGQAELNPMASSSMLMLIPSPISAVPRVVATRPAFSSSSDSPCSSIQAPIAMTAPAAA